MIRFLLLLTVFVFTISCSGAFKPKKVDTREVSTNAQERARTNIKTGRGGVNFGNIIGKGSTTYEFSSSNPMWRASLETLDFLPLTTVDYSGGMIITDWYSDNTLNDFVKITVRFLSNEVAAENLKILVHKKTCTKQNTCKTLLLQNDRISQELLSTIIKKAVLLEKNDKTKK